MLVCAQKASKKITVFVPLGVHFLEIRRRGSWNKLPKRRSGITVSQLDVFSPRDLFIAELLFDPKKLGYDDSVRPNVTHPYTPNI